MDDRVKQMYLELVLSDKMTEAHLIQMKLKDNEENGWHRDMYIEFLHDLYIKRS